MGVLAIDLGDNCFQMKGLEDQYGVVYRQNGNFVTFLYSDKVKIIVNATALSKNLDLDFMAWKLLYIINS